MRKGVEPGSKDLILTRTSHERLGLAPGLLAPACGRAIPGKSSIGSHDTGDSLTNWGSRSKAQLQIALGRRAASEDGGAGLSSGASP